MYQEASQWYPKILQTFSVPQRISHQEKARASICFPSLFLLLLSGGALPGLHFYVSKVVHPNRAQGVLGKAPQPGVELQKYALC